MTAEGLVVAGMFLFVTRGKPLSKLSPRSPPSSPLSSETLVSMAGQFAIHLMTILAVTFMADLYKDDYDPSSVPDGPFNPNTLNTSTFLVTVLATVNTFLVNYRGRPFMQDLRENKLLYRSIQICYVVIFACALDIFPPLNQLLQLSTLPATGPPAENLSANNLSLAKNVIAELVELFGYRTLLCGIMCLDTCAVMVVEKGVRVMYES